MVNNYLNLIKEYVLTNSKTIFIVLICLFALLRIYLGANLNIWFFVNSPHDDLLMLAYSNIPKYFNEWNILTLSKTISYPLFLFFVNFTGISYKLWLSIICLISGFLVMYAINKYITKNKVILILAFIFILFQPFNFEITTSARIYRNAILMPCTIIFLTTLYILINQLISKEFNSIKTIFWGIIVGLTFTFTFYIKEDGIMLLPILAVSLLVIILFKLYKLIKENKQNGKKFFSKPNMQKLIKIIIICIIPLLLFSAMTIGLKEVNNHYFGVSEINTRTDGEIGDFWKNLLKIDDPNKTIDVWVPTSTYEKAWNASPTLQSRPDLLGELLNSSWSQGNHTKTPAKGDHPSWALRDALYIVGLFDSEKTANDFFFKVNNELDQAFENGTLEESDKIFITSSATGKSVDELSQMIPYIIWGLKTNLFYENIGYETGPIPTSTNTVANAQTEYGELVLNDNFIIATNNPDTVEFKEKIPTAIINTDILLYHTISYILVALSLIGFIGLGIHQIKNKFKNRTLTALVGFQLLLLGTFIVQIMGIAWFSSWIELDISGIMKFYTASSQGVFSLFEILSICGLIYLIINKKTLKGKFKN